MGPSTVDQSASSRHAARLVWALAFIGLALGAFVLTTLDLLLDRTRVQRDTAFNAAQSTGCALADLDHELARAREDLQRALEHVEPLERPDWAGPARSIVERLDAQSAAASSSSITAVRQLRASVEVLARASDEVVGWTSDCTRLAAGLNREATHGELDSARKRAPELRARVDRALHQIQLAQDGMWQSTAEEMRALALQSEDDLERAQLRILVAATLGAAAFLALAFFTWRAITRQIRSIESTNRELDLAIVEARTADRSKSEFLANMSHEIRTPMNGVLGMTNLLLETGLDAGQRELAETAKSSAEALLDIINQILDFSKIEAGKMVIESIELSPRAVVEDVVELLAERAAHKRIELYCDIDDDVPTCVVGDPVRLRQVLFNLVGNAVKFTERGEVRVEVRTGPRPWHESAALAVEFTVADTGVGISEAARERLFQPFTQADGSTTRRFGGTGLGLAISKQLIELFGGSISFESEIGRGTRFRFSVPFGRVSKTAPDESQSQTLLGKRALVVEDHAGYAEVVRAALEHAGMRAQVAGSARAARAAVSADPGAFDVVLLDTELEGEDSTGFALELADPSLAAAPKLLLLSPRVRASLVNGTARQLAAPRLFKPVRFAVLLECVEELLRREPSPALPASSAAPASNARSGAKVLLVEDNRVNQMVARRMLERMGHTVALAENGREALELTAEQQFDVVLMDCQMPEMDGYEATRAIRVREAGARHLPIVAMTAHAMVGDREQCLAAGMDDYLTKPVRAEDLDEVLVRVLAAAQRPS
ncbi:MAG: response regulator [Planctomycetes bacterium]|nr:response regulator [Planctomycetota bacterium]